MFQNVFYLQSSLAIKYVPNAHKNEQIKHLIVIFKRNAQALYYLGLRN